MRLTFLLLLLCLSLSAGNSHPLDAAVKSFSSDELAERQAATRTVRRHLEAALAPLLAAMKSDDPEVARRAREALEGLLPRSKKPINDGIPGEVINKGGWIQIAQGGAQIRFLIKGQNGRLVVQGGAQQKKIAALMTKYGLQGHACVQVLVRKQLGLAEGRGYVVTRVDRRLAANRAGLRAHDIILSIDGKPVLQPAAVVAALGKQMTWGGKKFRVMRAGKVVSLNRQGR